MPRFAELSAPANWRTVDFISDLHLQGAQPDTFDAWCRYMAGTSASAVFILGDLFEVWVGDDAATPASFEAQCVAVLQAAAAVRPVYFMHGNRDFLAGPALMAACGATLLDDPTVLSFESRRWLLTHGDALCLADTGYMAFRAQVRTPQWQADFLARPLTERQAIARGLRDASEQRKRDAASNADLDADATRAWLSAASAPMMIHGHTHKPAVHDLGHGRSRVVLSDWDACATPQRLEVLRLSASGLQRIPLH